MESAFKFGDRVEIGGRTMLRPGFSLVGLTGMIFPSGPGTPPGCATVAVDWQAHGYNEESGYPEGSLPLLVNVPIAYLELVETNSANSAIASPKLKTSPNAEVPQKPVLHMVRDDEVESQAKGADEEGIEEPAAPTKPAAQKEEQGEEKPDDEEPPRPRLRLV